MRWIINLAVSVMAISALTGCGGAETVAPEHKMSKVEEANQAIAIIRHSFEVMGGKGGIERLRLAASKVKITGTASAEGKTFPIKIMLGGPDQFRLDYVDDEISFVYSKGKCRKIVYGVSARCTPQESMWLIPVRILQGLTYPAGDAANLDSNFRMRDDITVNGKACVVPEIRPKNSNLKIRAAYDKASGLLAGVTFYFKDEKENKDNWAVTFDDWRTAKKMLAPYRRSVSHEGSVLWQETIQTVDFDGYDERAFRAPVPPTTDSPLPYNFPKRRFARLEVDGQKVEVPAPYTTLGGGGVPEGAVEEVEAMETIRIVHRGPVSRASSLFEQLKGGAMSAGRQAVGEPTIILLEKPYTEGEPALMLLYLRLASQEVKVDVSM